MCYTIALQKSILQYFRIMIDNASIYSQLNARLLMKIVHAKHFMTSCFSGHCTACKLINGMAGIFGSQNKSTASYIQSICDMDILYIVARWDSEPKYSNVINLYLHSDALWYLFLFINLATYKIAIDKQSKLHNYIRLTGNLFNKTRN